MGFIQRLVRLANELSDDDGPRTFTGERGGPRGRVNYGVSFGSVTSGRPRGQRSQPRQQRQRYLTNAREEDGNLVVTIDLPDVRKDDLGVTFDDERNVVEIRDGDRPIKQLGFDWDDAQVTGASYNNHILELQIGQELPDG